MELHEAQEVLNKIEYKPGHELRWISNMKGTLLRVHWEFERPDCLNPSEVGVGESGPVLVLLHEVTTEEQLVRMVFGMTMRLEEHEAREFFKYGDKRPFDPHKALL